MTQCKHYDREEIDLDVYTKILRCKDCGEKLDEGSSGEGINRKSFGCAKIKWGNFWITCKTCGNKRHTGTDHNARLIKEAHEHNHKGHECEIKNEDL